MLPAFTNFALLAGLTALTAPILIHLLLRRRSQRLRFSSIQFFVKRDEQSMRKRRLRNLFLLALRCVLFTLLVLAFARPYLPNSAAANGRLRQQVVIVLDGSASMSAEGPNGTAWNRAKAAAGQILAGLAPDDRAALVQSPGGSGTEFFSPAVLAQKISELKASAGSGDLSEALNRAAKVVQLNSAGLTSTVWVVSDLQRSAIQNLAATPVPRELRLQIRDLRERFAPNIAVTDLETGEQPHVVITSFSDERASVPFEVMIDRKTASRGEVKLQPGAITNVPLALPNLAPGWHSIEISVQGKDALEMDNRRYAALLVPEPLKALVIESRRGVRAFEEETFFVTSALNPALDTNQASGSRFAYDKTDSNGLAQRLSGPGAPRLVIVPGMKEIAAGAITALKTFVEQGGGILMFVGPEVSAIEYNQRLREILPAELERVEAGEEEAAWRIAEYKKSSAVFAPFRQANSGNLAIPEFTRRFRLKAIGEAQVLAAFDDNVPMLIERSVGQGKVLLVNSSADTAWTDWQKHKTFVPWVHAAAEYLAGAKAVEATAVVHAFNSGTEGDVEIGRAGQAVTLQGPDGQPRNLTTDKEGWLRDVPLERPGIYSIKDSTGREMRRIAVNVSAAESDLTYEAPADFERQIVRRTESAPQNLTASLFGDGRQGREFWRVLLLGALILLIFEPFVANRTAA